MNAPTRSQSTPRTLSSAIRWSVRTLLVCLLAVTAIAQPTPTPTANPAQPPAQATVPIVPASRQADNIAILTIEGGIDSVTAASIERRLEEAVAGGANAVVIDLNTPGGEVPSVLEICSMVKRSPVPTYGWVNPAAYSGGAFIALACDEIILAPSGTMGDAAPVSGNPIAFAQGLAPTEVVQALAAKKIIASTSPYHVTYARLAPSLLNDEAQVDAAVDERVEVVEIGRAHV